MKNLEILKYSLLSGVISCQAFATDTDMGGKAEASLPSQRLSLRSEQSSPDLQDIENRAAKIVAEYRDRGTYSVAEQFTAALVGGIEELNWFARDMDAVEHGKLIQTWKPLVKSEDDLTPMVQAFIAIHRIFPKDIPFDTGYTGRPLTKIIPHVGQLSPETVGFVATIIDEICPAEMSTYSKSRVLDHICKADLNEVKASPDKIQALHDNLTHGGEDMLGKARQNPKAFIEDFYEKLSRQMTVEAARKTGSPHDGNDNAGWSGDEA